MHKVCLISLVPLLLLAGHPAHGQSELDRLSDKIKNVVEAERDGWTCKRGQPMGDQTALLESCYTSAPDPRIRSLTRHPRGVSMYIDPHGSAEEARLLMQSYARKNAREYQRIDDLGDEAYGWAMDKADIVMRKGRFILWIHPNAAVDIDPDANALSADQRSARAREERLRIGPKYARLAIAALDSF